LFNYLQLVEPVHGTRGSSEAALSQKAGAGAQATRCSPGAALSREAGAGTVGTRGGPEAAPSREAGAGVTGTRGAPRAALSREAGAGAAGTRGGPGAALPFVLTWSLYAEVPGLQGTDNHSPVKENHDLSRALDLCFGVVTGEGIFLGAIVFLPLSRSLIVILPPFFNFVILPLRFQNEAAVCPWDITPLAWARILNFKK
jgi:hypothetical protein